MDNRPAVGGFGACSSCCPRACRSFGRCGPANFLPPPAPTYRICNACRPCCPPAGGPPCPPCSPCPPCPIFPPCPPCPTPENPAVACTGGLPGFLDASQAVSNLPVNLVNAFNLNDGPPPYTALSAEFILGNQQAIFNLEVIDIPPAPYQMRGEIRPTVMLLYRDGTGATRSKFIYFPVAVSQSFPRPAAPDGFDFFISLQSGAITGLTVSGNTLSFTADFIMDILGFANQPQHFAVLPDYSCEAPPVSYPTLCVSMVGLRSFCNVGPGAFFAGIVPFQRIGTPPFSSISLEILPTLPNVLIAANAFEGIDMQLSFPALLRYVDVTGTPFVQSVFIIGSLSLAGPTLGPDEVVYADLRVINTSQPIFTGTALVVSVVSITGSITIMRNHAAQTLVTPLVSCGPFPADGVCVLQGGIITETIPSL